MPGRSGFHLPGSLVSFEKTQPNQILFYALEPINCQTGNDWKDQGVMRFAYFHRRPRQRK